MKSLFRRLLGKTSSLNSDRCEDRSKPAEIQGLETETLEPRMLFSAAPVEAPDAQQNQDAAESQEQAADESVAATETGESNQQGDLSGSTLSGENSETPVPVVSADTAIAASQQVNLVDLGAESERLHEETLNFMVEAAAERWRATGLTAEQDAALEDASFAIADFGGNVLGATDGHSIVIDDDGAGWGWFIDTTPGEDEEFGSSAPTGVDLLSVILHEQGHILGLEETGEVGDVMNGVFDQGERRLPISGQAQGGIAGSLEGVHQAVTSTTPIINGIGAGPIITSHGDSGRLNNIFDGIGGPAYDWYAKPSTTWSVSGGQLVNNPVGPTYNNEDEGLAGTMLDLTTIGGLSGSELLLSFDYNVGAGNTAYAHLRGADDTGSFNWDVNLSAQNGNAWNHTFSGTGQWYNLIDGVAGGIGGASEAVPLTGSGTFSQVVDLSGYALTDISDYEWLTLGFAANATTNNPITISNLNLGAVATTTPREVVWDDGRGGTLSASPGGGDADQNWVTGTNWRVDNTGTLPPNDIAPRPEDRANVAFDSGTNNNGTVTTIAAMPAAGAGGAVTIGAADNIAVHSVRIGTNPGLSYGGDGRVENNGGTLTVDNSVAGTGNNFILGADGDRSGVYIQTAGTLEMNGSSAVVIGDSNGEGFFGLSGGNVNADGSGFRLADDSTSHGSVVIDGGTLNVSGGNFETANAGTGVVTMNDGNLNVNSNNLIVGQSGSSNATFNMNDGTVDLENQIRIANNGTGAFNMIGGTVNVGTILDLSNSSSTATSPGQATLDVSGGILNISDRAAGGLIIGNANNAGASAAVTVSGTADVNVLLSGVRIADNGSNSSGSLTQSGGTVDVAGGNTEVADNGTGILTISGGTYSQNTSNIVVGQEATSNATVNVSGTGILDIENDLNIANRGTGLVEISGGTVNVGQNLQMANNAANDSTATLRMTGGTLNVSDRVAGTFRIGNEDRATSTALVEILDGMVNILNGTSLRIADTGANSSGTLIVGDGTSTPTINLGQQFESADNGTGTFTFRSGTLNQTANNFITGQAGSSVSNVTIGGFAGTATYNLIGTRDWNTNSGDGNVTVLSNGIVNVGRTLNLGNNGSEGGLVLDIDGGRVNVGTSTTGDVNYRTNGIRDEITLQGGGTFDVNRHFNMDEGTGILNVTGSGNTFDIGGAYSQNAASTLNFTADATGLSTVDVTGAANLAGTLTFDLSALGSVTDAGGDIVLIDSASRSGTLSIAEGTTVATFADGTAFMLTYLYDPATGTAGSGTDVALVAVAETEAGLDGSGNFVIEDTLNTTTADDFRIEMVDGDTNVQVTNSAATLVAKFGATQVDANTVKIAATAITGGEIIVNGLGGNDNLTIEFGGGNFDNEAITFDGGGQTLGGGDELFLTGGGTFTDNTYNHTDENSGTIDITGNETITYTGLEPITSTLTATNVTLNYSAVDETITVTESGASTRVDSTAGEAVTFTGPSTLLTINAGDGADTINLNGFAPTFGAGLAIFGQDGSDRIFYGADSVSLTGTNGANFSAERIDVWHGDLTTAGGNITLTGTGGSGGTFEGVHLLKGQLSAGGMGTITLTGDGGDTGSANHGVHLSNGSTITTNDGDIDIDGTGGGDGALGNGVAINSGSTLKADNGGNITIDGTSTTSGTVANNGVFFGPGTGATVENGDLTIKGTGAGTGISRGIYAPGGLTLTGTGSGNITLTGTSSGTGTGNSGILLSAATVTTATGSGAISMDGTGSTSGTSLNDGVKLSNTDLSTGGNANILINGTGGGTGSGVLNVGVSLDAGTMAMAHGSGTVTINGTGGSGTSLNKGVFVGGVGASIKSTSGAITIKGTGNGTGSLNRGIETSTADISTGGNITLNGTGSTAGIGVFNTGISLLGSATTGINAGGNLMITGLGGTGSTLNEGVRVVSGSLSGTLTLTGTANAGTSLGVFNSGVYLLNAGLGSATGSITGVGGGGSGFNHGIYRVGITFGGSLNGSTTDGNANSLDVAP